MIRHEEKATAPFSIIMVFPHPGLNADRMFLHFLSSLIPAIVLIMITCCSNYDDAEITHENVSSRLLEIFSDDPSRAMEKISDENDGEETKQEVEIQAGDDDSLMMKVKLAGYRKYGSLMYRKDLNYPVPAQNNAKIDPSAAPSFIRLKENVKPNKKANISGWVPVETGDGKVYWRAEYHVKDLDIPDPFKLFKRRKGDRYDETKIDLMRDRSKLHMVSFPLCDFRAFYDPGKTLLRQEDDGSKKGWLKGGKKVNPNAKSLYKKSGKVPEDKRSDLVAILNGTYFQQNTWYYFNKKLNYAGLVVNGKTVVKPSNHHASFAIYDDDNVRIARYMDLPEKHKIMTLRQNDLMIMEDGAPGVGSDPLKFRRFEDNFVRSYVGLCKDRQHLAYIWTNYAPTEVLVNVLQNMGFLDVMLLDIHAVIAAKVVNPGGNKGDFLRHSYDFVPDAKIFGMHFQWNPASALKWGSRRDYFAILSK